MLADLGEPQELLDAEAALAECALLRGDPVDALHLADGALKRGHADNASVLPTLHRVRGFSFLVLGDVEAAGAAFDAGLQLQEPAARHEMAFLTVGAGGGAPARGTGRRRAPVTGAQRPSGRLASRLHRFRQGSSRSAAT